MDFAGKLVKFDWTEVIAALTTGLVLMSLATAFVDGVMTVLMPLKDKFTLLKYQTSEDFHDAKTLRVNAKGKLNSGFPSAEVLLSKLTEEGELKGEGLTKEELVTICNSHDIRLNRLDGMCPQADFTDAGSNPVTGTDPRWFNMGNFKRQFYSKVCGSDKIKL